MPCGCVFGGLDGAGGGECRPAGTISLRGIVDAQADERVAAAQMVVEEGEGRADGEAVQPERDLGQFDGQRVLVDAVDAAFEDHAADDGLVGELGLVDHPIGGVCPRQNVLTDSGDAFNQGRCVGARQPGRDGRRVFDQFENGVGEVVDSGDEEVAAAHGGVEHFEVERGFGRVQTAQFGDAVGFGAGGRSAEQRPLAWKAVLRSSSSGMSVRSTMRSTSGWGV